MGHSIGKAEEIIILSQKLCLGHWKYNTSMEFKCKYIIQ